MPRPLTKTEKFFILNSEDSDKVVASQIDGVGEKTVAKYRAEHADEKQEPTENISAAVASEEKQDANTPKLPQQADPNVAKALEIAQQTSEEVRKSPETPPPNPASQQHAGLKVDALLGRRLKPDGSHDRAKGIVVMTPAASELADDRKRRSYKKDDVMEDARDILAVKTDPLAGSRNSKRIHKIRPDESSQ
jgi:type IV secretory pathway VirB10-like protein